MKNQILVTSYTDPDLDGLSSTYAYSDFLKIKGKDSIPSIYGKPHREAAFIIGKYGFKRAIEQYDPKDYEKFVLVDASDPDGIDQGINPEKVVEIIDHRSINDSEKFPNAKVQIELVGAAATLVAERFITEDIEIPEDVAPLIYGAIISNTLNFKGNVTTDRDKNVAKYLKDKHGFSDNFAHEMFAAKSNIEGERLIRSIRDDFAYFRGWKFNGKTIGIAQIETLGGEEKTVPIQENIISELGDIKNNLEIDVIGFSVVDLEANQNLFYCPDRYSERTFSKALGLGFDKGLAKRSGLILRKEIIPKIKDVITEND